MIAQTLQAKIGEAMKARDTVKLSVLRLLSSAFNYKKIESKRELTDEEEIAVIRKEVKQRRDSIESYEKANRADLADTEKAELTILQEFLPPEMSDDDLNKIIDEGITTSGAKVIADMGKVIGFVKGKAPTADGSRVAQMIKAKLTV